MKRGRDGQLAGSSLGAWDLLQHLIKDRFSGKAVVTASLKASSIVVLKMIADIDNKTPVIFCRRPPSFEESTEYRAKIVDLLGLQNISINEGHETGIKAGDMDHSEHMWIQHQIPGRSFQILHLNDCLAPYSCWISAVYHVVRPPSVRARLEVEGRLAKVDPLFDWSSDDVRAFMKEHRLPYHQMAKKDYKPRKVIDDAKIPTYHY